jgi:hypothetical protein
MHIVDPDRATRRLLDRFEKAGGALEFVSLDAESSELTAGELHKKAAVMAYNFVQRIYHEKLEGIVSEERFWEKQISRDEFFGPLFYTRNCRLVLKNCLSDREMHGYAYAFSQPPHGLQVANELFAEFYTSIFHGFPAGTEFWQWTTDDLRYFDDGREWWGTFFWTVRPEAAGRIVAILGSSTD